MDLRFSMTRCGLFKLQQATKNCCPTGHALGIFWLLPSEMAKFVKTLLSRFWSGRKSSSLRRILLS